MTMNNNDIFNAFQQGFPIRHFIRIGENRLLSLYIGRDDEGRYSFDFRGHFKPARIPDSDVIAVGQYKEDDVFTLRFSLENKDLLEYFCTFCQDLLDSVKVVSEDDTAYRTLRSRYYSWRHLFRPDSPSLTENEIMGLLGELLFLKEYLIPNKGIEDALDSWMGPEKTHKDFSNNQEWFEVKTINVGKERVKISSIEQLDSGIDGYLVVIELEKMSPTFRGLRLNQLVNDILSILSNSSQRELFMAKLQLYGFDFSSENDNFVYDFKKKRVYKVDTISFPKMRRDSLPNAILQVQYDLLLTELETYKTQQIWN